MNRKRRLDTHLVALGLVTTRSQAESYIKLGQATVNKKIVTKPGILVSEADKTVLTAKEQYVSRAALKLASVADKLSLDFRGKVVLDVGSSTGGFTDFALRRGASKLIAVDVGTNQLHPSLRQDPRIELYEQTDIRQVDLRPPEQRAKPNEQKVLIQKPDIILIDASFISLRSVLPHISKLMIRDSLIVAMAKPQFETPQHIKHKGVVKNERLRRNTLQELENWIKNLFIILEKADSEVSGAKGNQERFYLLKQLAKSN